MLVRSGELAPGRLFSELLLLCDALQQINWADLIIRRFEGVPGKSWKERHENHGEVKKPGWTYLTLVLLAFLLALLWAL